MTSSVAFFALVLFGNLWVYQLLDNHFLVFLLTTTFSICLFLLLQKQRRNRYLVFMLVLLAALFLQWKTTEINRLTYKDNDEQRVVAQRINKYPPTSIQLGPKTIWLPFGHWFENRNELLALSRMEKNLFENLDVNQYFFATHPFERQGFKEFEKFPYIYLPFFITGIIQLVQNKKGKLLSLFLLPLGLMTVIGNKNELGPFTLFPFFVVSIAEGFQTTYKKMVTFSPIQRRITFGCIFVVALVVFIQLLSYVKN